MSPFSRVYSDDRYIPDAIGRSLEVVNSLEDRSRKLSLFKTVLLYELVANYINLGATIEVRVRFDIVSDSNRGIELGIRLHLRILSRRYRVYVGLGPFPGY